MTGTFAFRHPDTGLPIQPSSGVRVFFSLGRGMEAALEPLLPWWPAPQVVEIRAAICAFTKEQWKWLYRFARKYARRPLLDHEDLVQEACCRALGGDRKCPSHVSVDWFLAQVIRSIADAHLRWIRRGPVMVSYDSLVTPPADPSPGVADQLDPIDALHGLMTEPADQSPRADEQPDATEFDFRRQYQRQQLIDLFADDRDARVIVEGMMDGKRGEALRALTDLDETAYQTKRRLIRRRIEEISARPKTVT
jgi:DNA-directed RNA polymerase specialized sigma24 family protein